LLSLFSCNDEETTTFNKAALVENITDHLILPSFEILQQQTNALERAAIAFHTNATSSHLTALQATWKATTLQWKKSEIYVFGEVAAYKSQIYFYPARANLMENVLADQAAIDANYMLLVGAAAKGLPALELLLFENGKTTAEILTNFTSDIQAARKRDYVVGIARHLNRQAANLLEEWQIYAPTFKASVSGTMDGVSILANQLLLMTENAVNAQLGAPLGKSTGGNILPEKVEAYHSNYSNELMLANLQSVSNLYDGNTQLGFDDYLDFVQKSPSLSESIRTQLSTFISAIEQFEQPLQEMVVDRTSSVEKAYEEGKKLTVLIKADLFSTLSITIAFTDNDGD